MTKQRDITDNDFQALLELFGARGYGNKRDLIPQILRHVPPDTRTFIDLFAFSSVVGWAAKWRRRCRIITNDIMRHGYLRARTFVVNNGTTLTPQDLAILQRPNPRRGHCIRESYSEVFGGRNALFLDNWASNIDQLSDPLKQNIAACLPLIITVRHNQYACFSISRTGGLTGNRGYYWRLNMAEEIAQYARDVLPRLICNNHKNNIAYQEDAVSLIRRLKADVCYCDPPYVAPAGNYTQHYSFLDHMALMLEGKWDSSTAPTRTNAPLPPHTNFYSAAPALQGFAQLFENSHRIRKLIISYNTSSDIDVEEIASLARMYGRSVQRDGPFSRTLPTTVKGNPCTTEEVLLICE